ncbi:MAG: HAD hydrolase family protein [Elusimicrobia bacterium]|nr:HAD hydrolase family protein [Candidatus Liberimonas magnetica]
MKLNVHDIKLIIYDFDGVMTNNTVMIDQDGKEYVTVSRSDGLAVILIKKMNIPQLILTAETNHIVSNRAKKLGIDIIQTVENKLYSLKDYLIKNKINREGVVYLGNEINDMEAMKYVGFSVCPADANEKIKKISDIVLKTKGGYGAIREFFDILMGVEEQTQTLNSKN